MDYELIGYHRYQANINLKTLSRGMLRQILQLPDLLRKVSNFQTYWFSSIYHVVSHQLVTVEIHFCLKPLKDSISLMDQYG